jgi:L-histidine N-alpha-methyltransferase
VTGLNGEYQDAFPVIRELSPVMVVFLGSTIGNFEPEEESSFLSALASSLSPGDFFLLGVDLVKDSAIVESAYNDAAGVTADFTRNLFARMNRELGSGIDLLTVEHVARYDPSAEQVDIHARFTAKQAVDIGPLGKSFAIADGEMVQTEISRKYRLEEHIPYLEAFGFEAEEVFTDEQGWFALILLRRTDSLAGTPGWRL